MLVPILLFVATMAISLIAAGLVKSKFKKWSQVDADSGLTGAEAASRILRQAGIFDVQVVPYEGIMSDHYDPTNKTLALSEGVYGSRSVAALGIAAHEAGHALQHAQLYAPLAWRMSAVKITSFASGPMILLPMILMVLGMLKIGLILMVTLVGITMIFNLITLPVEFDASRRAKALLVRSGMVRQGGEERGVNEVLNAAGLTYVAAFVTSLAYLLYYLMPLLTGRSED
ncbi:MAG: zinc metallopeptidase [Verrucomicrobiota bacterium]